MWYTAKYLSNRVRDAAHVDTRTVKIMNVFMVLAWVLNLTRQPGDVVNPWSAYAQMSDSVWVLAFLIVGFFNLTALVARSDLARLYAFVSAVVLWTAVSSMGFLSPNPGIWGWIHALFALASGVAAVQPPDDRGAE